MIYFSGLSYHPQGVYGSSLWKATRDSGVQHLREMLVGQTKEERLYHLPQGRLGVVCQSQVSQSGRLPSLYIQQEVVLQGPSVHPSGYRGLWVLLLILLRRWEVMAASLKELSYFLGLQIKQ